MSSSFFMTKPAIKYPNVACMVFNRSESAVAQGVEQFGRSPAAVSVFPFPPVTRTVVVLQTRYTSVLLLCVVCRCTYNMMMILEISQLGYFLVSDDSCHVVSCHLLWKEWKSFMKSKGMSDAEMNEPIRTHRAYVRKDQRLVQPAALKPHGVDTFEALAVRMNCIHTYMPECFSPSFLSPFSALLRSADATVVVKTLQVNHDCSFFGGAAQF